MSEQVIYGIGISPRDELAAASGIKVAPRGGVDVNDDLMTSAQDVYAIGECASWRGNVRPAPSSSSRGADAPSSRLKTAC